MGFGVRLLQTLPSNQPNQLKMSWAQWSHSLRQLNTMAIFHCLRRSLGLAWSNHRVQGTWGSFPCLSLSLLPCMPPLPPSSTGCIILCFQSCINYCIGAAFRDMLHATVCSHHHHRPSLPASLLHSLLRAQLQLLQNPIWRTCDGAAILRMHLKWEEKWPVWQSCNGIIQYCMQ